MVQKTLALIKPDAVHKANDIVEHAYRAGYTVLHRKRLQMTPEEASEFFDQDTAREYFTSLVTFMASGPMEALVLTNGSNTVEDWTTFIGPEDPVEALANKPGCIRAMYGDTNPIPELQAFNFRNAVHGSKTPEAAAREIRFFFPDDIVDPLPSSQEAREYVSEHINPTLLKGLTVLVKEKPEDPLLFLASWLDDNNPNAPRIEEPE